VIAVDTSVVVAGFASWHEGHASAAAALARRPRAPAHVLVETYSVLTRLPPPHRAPASIVAAFLAERFREPPLALPARAHLRLIEEAAAAQLSGGSIHDALIAATARHARARLLTRDRRAVAVYDTLGVDYDLIG
jgi:predicted nucleic acid-binding protein